VAPGQHWRVHLASELALPISVSACFPLAPRVPQIWGSFSCSLSSAQLSVNREVLIIAGHAIVRAADQFLCCQEVGGLAVLSSRSVHIYGVLESHGGPDQWVVTARQDR